MSLVTTEPTHQQLGLDSPHGPIVADLLLPIRRFGAPSPHSQPAVILAMGVKTSERDRLILLSFAPDPGPTGVRRAWPRREALDAGVSLPEEPGTFVAGVRYLEGVDQVDKERISVLGFSVGASIALVAASDPSIAERVHAVIFFGGYYDILSFLVSLATQSIVVDGQGSPGIRMMTRQDTSARSSRTRWPTTCSRSSRRGHAGGGRAHL